MSSSTLHSLLSALFRLRGAMVARLTPDQKVACSIHVGVTLYVFRDPSSFVNLYGVFSVVSCNVDIGPVV